MKAEFKNVLINVAKLGVAGGLIYWMVESGQLDFRQLSVLYSSWHNLAIVIGGWAVVLVGLSGLRWFILLRGIGLMASYPRAVQLNLIGLFFNSTMPGAVGGDIIKAVYVLRDHNAQTKTPAMLTILLDRIVGMMALFVMGTVSVTVCLGEFWNSQLLQPLVVFMYGLFACTLVFFALVLFPRSEGNDPIQKVLNLNVFGFSLLRKIYKALLAYRERPMALFGALGVSIVIQTLLLTFFIYAFGLIGEAVDPWRFAAIYPIAMVTTALPLAPGGLGVGHVAFQQLSQLIGVENGANVFNLFLLAHLSCNMLGVLPYLLIKRREPEPIYPVEADA